MALVGGNIGDYTNGGWSLNDIGSVSDLYPKAAAMQRLAGAESFAVFSAKAQTAINPGLLSVLLESPHHSGTFGVSDLAAAHSTAMLTHLWRSPMPLRFDAMSVEPISSGYWELEVPRSKNISGIAFPVQLGAMGNGYTAFFGVTAEITPDFCIDLHRKSVSLMREALKLEHTSIPALDTLSEREIECLQLVGDGLKSEAIGASLGLSVHTVNAYLGSATTKLDAVNRIQAIAKAIRLGLIS